MSDSQRLWNSRGLRSMDWGVFWINLNQKLVKSSRMIMDKWALYAVGMLEFYGRFLAANKMHTFSCSSWQHRLSSSWHHQVCSSQRWRQHDSQKWAPQKNTIGCRGLLEKTIWNQWNLQSTPNCVSPFDEKPQSCRWKWLAALDATTGLAFPRGLP